MPTRGAGLFLSRSKQTSSKQQQQQNKPQAQLDRCVLQVSQFPPQQNQDLYGGNAWGGVRQENNDDHNVKTSGFCLPLPHVAWKIPRGF